MVAGSAVSGNSVAGVMVPGSAASGGGSVSVVGVGSPVSVSLIVCVVCVAGAPSVVAMPVAPASGNVLFGSSRTRRAILSGRAVEVVFPV